MPHSSTRRRSRRQELPASCGWKAASYTSSSARRRMNMRWRSPARCGERLAGEDIVDPMFLPEVEKHAGAGRYAAMIRHMQGAGIPVPQIMHLFAYKPDRTDHLAEF